MASLYIKDAEVSSLAERLARRDGVTKTAAVKLALLRELERGDGSTGDEVEAILRRHWAVYPPPPEDAPVADKAFYDHLSGDGPA